MAQGRKTGGRKAGTPNRRTAELVERLAELDVDPVETLATVVKDESVSLETRVRVCLELMNYVFPKRRATDISATEGSGEISITWAAPTAAAQAIGV